jgi:hypothetical protein
MPKQFAAVRIEFVDTIGLITCDNEYPFSALRMARVEKVARKPYPHIPDRFELVGNSLKRGPAICAEEARHIFKHEPFRFAFFCKANKVEEKPTSRTTQSFPIGVGVTEVLTWPSS